MVNVFAVNKSREFINAILYVYKHGEEHFKLTTYFKVS